MSDGVASDAVPELAAVEVAHALGQLDLSQVARVDESPARPAGVDVASDAGVGLPATVARDVGEFESAFVADHLVKGGVEGGHVATPS